MKKTYSYNEFSSRICERKSCNTKLKKRRVEEHNDTLCYKCNLRAKLKTGKWANAIGKLRRAGLISRHQAEAAKAKIQQQAGTCPV